MPVIRELLGRERLDLPPDLGVAWGEGRIEVTFSNGRKQKIYYRQEDGFFRFTSKVVSPETVCEIGRASLARRVLEANRTTELIGFRFDAEVGIEAFVDHRAETLQRGELVFAIEVLAREADRFEYLVSGADAY